MSRAKQNKNKGSNTKQPSAVISDSSVQNVLARLSHGLGSAQPKPHVVDPSVKNAGLADDSIENDDGGEDWEDDDGDEVEEHQIPFAPVPGSLPEQVKHVKMLVEKVEASKLDDSGDEESEEESNATGDGAKKSKKKKKKKKSKKAYTETPEQTAHYLSLLSPTRKKQGFDYHRFPDPYRRALDILYTPACRLTLKSSLHPSKSYKERKAGRLILRGIEVGDLANIAKIKCEPLVNKTQMYGQYAPSDIGPMFLFPYIAASMPASWSYHRQTIPCRSQYCFAITIPNASSPDSGIKLLPPPKSIKSVSSIKTLSGYLGNIALKLEIADPSAAITALSSSKPPSTLSPEDGSAWRYPPRKVLDKCGFEGKMYYELHPQLWGQGIMSEALNEILRFAFEDVGVSSVVIDPREGNTASIKLAEGAGFEFTHKTEGEHPQLWYKLSRGVWLARAGYACLGDLPDRWGGKMLCRWCNNFFMGEAKISCEHCDWGKWCSRECQIADWVYEGPSGAGGHRKKGGSCPSAKAG